MRLLLEFMWAPWTPPILLALVSIFHFHFLNSPPPTNRRQSFSCNCRHVSTLNGYKTASKTGKSKATCPHQRRTFLIYGHLCGACIVQQAATGLWTFTRTTFTWALPFLHSLAIVSPEKWLRSWAVLSALRLRGSTIYHDTNEHEIGQGLLNFPFKMLTCQGTWQPRNRQNGSAAKKVDFTAY